MGRLPAPYKEVEYLRTTNNNPYINPNISMARDQILDIDVVCDFVDTPSSSTVRAICGIGTSGASGTTFADVYGKKSYLYLRCFGNIKSFNYVSGKKHLRIRFSTDANEQSYLEDVDTGSKVTVAGKRNIVSNFTIFKSLHGNFKGDIYSFSISLNGELIRNLVPCYDTTDSSKHTAGLYDLVNNQFYGNAGTGNFTLGPETFDVSYSTEHGTAPSTVQKKDGYKLTSDDLPTLKEDGWFFDGWDHQVGDEITEDTVITASWTQAFVISYQSEHGTVPINKTVKTGYALKGRDLPQLSEDGFIFDGWDKEAGYEITEDTTITASWVVARKITYQSNYGNVPATKIVPDGYHLTDVDLKELKYTSLIFKGWYIGNVKAQAGYEVITDILLTASWNINTIVETEVDVDRAISPDVSGIYEISAELDVDDLITISDVKVE